jgi:hypothetical protein
MLLQGVRTSNQKEDKKNRKQFPKRKSKQNGKSVSNLTLDQQITAFAEIIVNQLLKDSNCL